MFNPYEDDSYLDIPVFKTDYIDNYGEVIYTSWELYEDEIETDIGCELSELNIKICTLRDCPKDIRIRLLKYLDDIKAQEEYEERQFYGIYN